MIPWQEQFNTKEFLENQPLWSLITEKTFGGSDFIENTESIKALKSLSTGNYYCKIRSGITSMEIKIAMPIDESFYLYDVINKTSIETPFKFGGYIIVINLLYSKNSNNFIFASYIVASINKCTHDYKFSHPHIKYVSLENIDDLDYRNNACLGNFSNTLHNLVNNYLLLDTFSIFKEYLKQYNVRSPYVFIDNFFFPKCTICGAPTAEILDNQYICLNCRLECKKCKRKIKNRSIYAQEISPEGEEIYLCINCFKTCPFCNRSFWKNCACKFHLLLSQEELIKLQELGINIPENPRPIILGDINIEFTY